jgi:1-acyl-sn-glycerol-3-phosphate acyltransferase|tara:strand:- start:321 stop:1082 length:762 start_codon:yes stop_codon:yes gene_type:complete
MEGLEQAWLDLEDYWRIEPSATLKNHRTYDLLRWILGPLCRVFLPWRIIGVQHIPKGKQMIIAANHLSHIDPVVIILSGRKKIHYLAKDGHFSNFFVRNFMHLTGQIETNRETGGDQALASAATIVAAGSTLGIFPEGTRSRNTSPPFLLKGKTGAARLAAAYPNVPVVPTAHHGTRDVMAPIIHKLPRLWRRVTISYGKPLIWLEWLENNSSTEQLVSLAEKDEEHIKAELGKLYRTFTDELMHHIKVLGAP